MDALKEWLKPEIIWLLVGIVLLITEMAIPGLIVAFFGIGAIIVAIVCFFAEISPEIQLVIFIGSSVTSLLLLRKWLKGIFMGHVASEQSGRDIVDDFIGQKAVVIEKIVPKFGGKVEFHGTNWSATADGDIAVGAAVEIVAKDNLTLKVKAV